MSVGNSGGQSKLRKISLLSLI